MSQRLTHPFDLNELLDFIVKRTVKIFQARSGSLMLIDRSSKRLIIRSAVGLRSDLHYQVRLRLGQGITGRCAQIGEAILVRDTRHFEAYVEAVPGTRSELAVPLLFQGRVFGVINLDSDQTDAFTKQDLKLLTTFASWAALAIKIKDTKTP